jgi:hypothetical protein
MDPMSFEPLTPASFLRRAGTGKVPKHLLRERARALLGKP